MTPGQTYYYRIGSSTYLGNTTTEPGQPVRVPEWNAPRPIPYLLQAAWDCPSERKISSSISTNPGWDWRLVPAMQQCSATVTVRLDPEPSESLAGCRIRVFLNEDSFQQEGGDGKDLPDINAAPILGRDLPGCVVRKPVADLEVFVPPDQSSVTFDMPGFRHGANGLRYEVTAPGGATAERALLHHVACWNSDTLMEDTYGATVMFFGDVITQANPTIAGLAPIPARSPDCIDGDEVQEPDSGQEWVEDKLYYVGLRYSDDSKTTIYSAHAAPGPDGTWEAALDEGLVDGGVYTFYVDDFFGHYPENGQVGRRILASDGTTVLAGHTYHELDRNQTYFTASLHQLAVHFDQDQDPHPPELSCPSPGDQVDLWSDSDLELDHAWFRFRVTDLHHDVDLSRASVTNVTDPDNPIQPAARVYYADGKARTSNDISGQFDSEHGDFGWLIAKVPLHLEPGSTDTVNILRIQAQDRAGSWLGDCLEEDQGECVLYGTDVEVHRRKPVVRAVITKPTEDLPDPRPAAAVHLDGTDSVGPASAVGKWVLFKKAPAWGEFAWFGPKPIDQLEKDFVFPAGATKVLVRLIVADQASDLPTDTWNNGYLPCSRTETGVCDAADFLIDAGCSAAPTTLPVNIQSPSGNLSVGPDETVQLQASASGTGTYEYRWLLFSSGDSQHVWPLVVLGDPDTNDGFSATNASGLAFTPADLGLAMGSYKLRCEARTVGGCAGGWAAGGADRTLTVTHTLEGIAPAQVVPNSSQWVRVYGRSLEGNVSQVWLDISHPPGTYLYSAQLPVQPGGYVRFQVGTDDDPDNNPRANLSPLPDGGVYTVSLSADSQHHYASTLWNALGVVEASQVLPQEDEESSACGTPGSECAHQIVPGQTIQGTWGQAGDHDYFSFVIGEGVRVRVDPGLRRGHGRAAGLRGQPRAGPRARDHRPIWCVQRHGLQRRPRAG